MSEPYRRTAQQRQQDFVGARAFEELVGSWIGPEFISRLDSTTDLDYMRPSVTLEIKEKKQKLTTRWHLLPGVEERDLFVLDELTVRKGLHHYPYCWLLFHDAPENRMFLAGIWELVTGTKVRRNRDGKGKWILDLSEYREVFSDSIMEQIYTDQDTLPWKRSECLAIKTVAQV